jgi:hypothetical protein
MKKIVTFLIISFPLFANAQNDSIAKPSVEKNIFGVQLGLVNFSFQNERKLSNRIALHSEVGLDLGTSSREDKEKNERIDKTTIIAPYIMLEPRFYYNLNKRVKKGKNIANNSANYIAVMTQYGFYDNPIIKNGPINIAPAFFVIPKFGIRRTFLKKFNYEFNGGFGYQYNIFSGNECNCEHDDTTVDIQARIGYTF